MSLPDQDAKDKAQRAGSLNPFGAARAPGVGHCWECGYTWPEEKSTRHSCTVELQRRLVVALGYLELLRDRDLGAFDDTDRGVLQSVIVTCGGKP